MNLLKQLFGKTVPTSANIAAEIDKARAELEAVRTKISNALAGIATMSDAEHVVAEALQAEQKRAEARLLARIDTLTADHERVLAEESEAARAAEEAAVAERVKAARAAVAVEAPKLLREYDDLAEKIAAIFIRLQQIDAEAAAVKIDGIEKVHRKHLDQPSSQRTALRPCWVYRYPGSPADTRNVKFQMEEPREEVRQATLTAKGEAKISANRSDILLTKEDAVPVGAVIHNYYGHEMVIEPTLELREVVVERTYGRPGAYLPSLYEVCLPPGLLGSSWHWPRPKE